MATIQMEVPAPLSVAVRYLRYAWVSALTNLWRNRLMSLAAILSTAAMVAMLSGFIVLLHVLHITIDALESKVNLIVYLRDDAAPGEVMALREKLLKDGKVVQVQYVSKEEALERLRRDMADRRDVLDAIPGNPLPASLEIWVRNPNALRGMAQEIRGEPPVEDLDFNEPVVSRLLAITNLARAVGLLAISGLAVVTLFIIMNTIRLAVYARREEIEIMKLVGATDWFVRWPFMFEGTLCGLAGAALAALAVSLAYGPAMRAVTGVLTFLPLAVDPLFLVKLNIGVLGIGGAVGAAGSYLAVRRFLHV
jgi:cell division transport system permease protein